MANAIVRPKLFKKRPMMPLMKATGRNTAMSESVVASTARPMSRVASAAATKGFCFFSSMKRTMFSRTTIASSMTMPTASARARSVMMLSVNPIAHMSAKVPMMETGMASAAMIVLRTLPRKMSTMTAAKNAPRTRCSLTALTLVRIDADSSRTTLSSEPGGSDFSTSPSRASTASTTATVFSPDCLRIDRTTLSLPSSEADVFGSSTPSSTRATSPMRVGWSWLSLMTMRPILATSSTRPSTRSERLFGPRLDLPARDAQVLLRERALHVDRGEPGGLELERVEPDVDLPLLAAEDVDLADAVDALDLAAHALVGELGGVADATRGCSA